jgi:hypothetical protein
MGYYGREVHRGVARFCHEAAKALHRLMQGEPPPKTCLRIAPKGLVIRKSTDMVAIPDVSFIRDHFRDPIANEVGFSSAPYMSAVFQRELSRSPGSFRR